MTYPFEKEPVSGIILIDVFLDKKHDFKMVLDTGASITTFDINALYMVEYPIVNNVIETGMVETANGIIGVDILKVDSLSALGHTISDMKVQIYDFFAHGILSDYDGVLGLDFFENSRFIIDMNNQTVEIEEYIKPL
jgi:hypothetical protein